MSQNDSMMQWLCTKNSKFQPILTCCIVFFLLVLPYAMADTTAENSAEVEPKKSPIKIGGAMRVNYAYGTYGDDDNPHPRGEKIGDADLEIFRLNADLDYQNIISRIEYRWYDSYSMIHTAWLGYNLGDMGTVKAGVVRVPFGPTAYGVSNSWFFDQHFYVGLADDMDVGIRWDTTIDELMLSVGYFLMSEPQTVGNSLASSRYSYDVVRQNTKVDSNGVVNEDSDKNTEESENGFDEQHQFNLRAIYSPAEALDVGVSLQYGMLKGMNVGDDDSGSHYALSGHLKFSVADITLYPQLTYYAHNITDDTLWGTGDLILMGAYDYPSLVASKGLIPAVSLRYGGIDTSSISWIDSVTPYAEFSTILKTVDDFNASNLFTLGASWTILGSLYVYSDFALTNGNFFVGNQGSNNFGANKDNVWNGRLNFNFGYYF